MHLNIEELKKFIKNNFKSSVPQAAEIFGINYSHLYRVLKEEKQAGRKLLGGILTYCKKNDIDFNIFLV